MFSRKFLTKILWFNSFILNKPKKLNYYVKLSILNCTETRYLSYTRPLNYKVYEENENSHYLNIMKESSKKYILSPNSEISESRLSNDDITTLLEINWEEKNADEILSFFIELSDIAYREKCDIASTIYDKFIDALADNICKLSDEQIVILCNNLCKWDETESVHTRNFIEIWAALDDALLKRYQNWDINKMFLFADCLHRLHLSRKSDYTFKMITYIGRKTAHLTPEQLVQIMFYICANRIQPYEILLFEERFENIFDLLSINEIGLICAAFFKTKSLIRKDSLLKRIIEKIMHETNTIQDITLTSILKELRLSSLDRLSNDICKMLDVLTPEIHRFSMMTCIHIALVTTKILVYHEKSLTAISNRFINNPELARLKDLERLAYAFSLYNYKNSRFYDCIVNEFHSIERKEEISKYPHCLSKGLEYLAMANVFPLDLIDQTLDPIFIKNTYGYITPHRCKNYNTGKELLILNCTIDIECPDYTGHRIDESLLKRLCNGFCDYMPNNSGKYRLSFIGNILLDIYLILEKTRGKSCVYGGHVIPCFSRPDIVIANDKNGNPVPVSKYVSDLNYTTVQRVPNIYDWFIFILISNRSRLQNVKTIECDGTINMKMRQLQKIGYNPIFITVNTWQSINDENAKLEFINKAIDNYKNKYIL